jgi:hypothetical protein
MPGRQLYLPPVRILTRVELGEHLNRYQQLLNQILEDVNALLENCPQCRPFHNCPYSEQLQSLVSDLNRLDAHVDAILEMNKHLLDLARPYLD